MASPTEARPTDPLPTDPLLSDPLPTGGEAAIDTDLVDRLVDEYSARWTGLVDRWATAPGTVLGTLGPSGTSSHLAADFLAERYPISLRLYPTFDEVLAALLAGEVDVVLVPSAYSGLTSFHWHRELELLGFFPRATPAYGIASRAEGPGDKPELRVSAMWEVRRIYHEVVPAELRDRPFTWVDAESTQQAAEILAAGGSDLAVTNDPGVRAYRLSWVANRPGAEIVWTVFGSRTRPLTPVE
ncbi:hypothetical protein [Kitasatospora sp. NPDC002040]|uniref:hypothetical protein n=1 Tax=Kitasatospora sp. NPDC002040 TaxID=3154661 RepID=UPI00332A3ED1